MGALHTGHLWDILHQLEFWQRHTHENVPRSHPFSGRERVRSPLDCGLYRREETLATKDMAARRDRGV